MKIENAGIDSKIDSDEIRAYVRPFESLTRDSKLDLAQRLIKSVRLNSDEPLSSFVGEWDSSKSEEEIMEDIRVAKTFIEDSAESQRIASSSLRDSSQ